MRARAPFLLRTAPVRTFPVASLLALALHASKPQALELRGAEPTPEDLAALVRDVRARTGVPALAAAWVHAGEVVTAAAGTLSVDDPTPVTSATPFQIGSLTKSMTACVAGRLVEDGRLGWDTTVGEVLGDAARASAYRGATLADLLRHRAGLPAYTDRRPEDHPADAAYVGTPTEQRAAFVADALATRPIGPIGSIQVYSNAGYVLAGHLCELATGTSYEELVRRHVFEPLALPSAGFGLPARNRGHVRREDAFVPVPDSAYPQGPWLAPAGGVHASVDDLARYAAAHLAGLRGRDGAPGFLRATTLTELHRAPQGGGHAAGWLVALEPGGGRRHEHGGTLGAMVAHARLWPGRDIAAVVLVGVEPAIGEPLALELLRDIEGRFRPDGFEAADAGLEVVEEPSDAAADRRLWRLVGALSRALNDEDRAAYHELFSPPRDGERADRDGLFDFLTRQVFPRRGGVAAFHALSAPLRVAGAERAMRLVTFHLDDGFPGYYGFELDDDERIAVLSLFVKADLCPHGVDPDCERIDRRLEELE